MEAASALRLVTHEPDNTWRDDDDVVLPVPLWVFALDIGPALGQFLGYCCGRCNLLDADSFETSLGKLLDDFPGRGERAIKRWIEDLRAPTDDDQVSEKTKYLRLGFLGCNKRHLKGDFRLWPLRPPAEGIKPRPRDAGPQKRLPLIEADPPQTLAPNSAVAPQELAPNSAVGLPQTLAHDPAVLAELLRAGMLASPLADYCGDETQWEIDGATVIVTVPHVCYKGRFRKYLGSVIGPVCRDVFPRGECFELRLRPGHSQAPADGGRDPPQSSAPNSAVLFKLKLSSLRSLKGNEVNELKVQVCAPQIFARADALAARLAPVPASFFRWQWIETAWAVETGRIPERELDATIAFCLGRETPAWQFARSAPRLFKNHRVGWLDPRRDGEREPLIARLSAVGVSWESAWEGPAAPRKPK